MPNKIQIYTDETKADNNSFIVYSIIFGTPQNIKALNNEIGKIIHPSKSKDKDFKGLHSHKLNDTNWNSLGKKFEQVLDVLFDYIVQDKINVKLCILGHNKYENNSGYLKNLFKRELDKDGSPIKRMYQSLDNKDHPALYHRLDQLFLYFIYRDKLGDEGTEFEFFPDSSGKILTYKEKEFLMTGTHNISANLDFYELVRILGNTVAKVIGTLKIPGWSTSNQELVKYDSLKWSNSYLIQLCDVLSNFFFCHQRFVIGLTDKKYELKSKAISDRFGLNEINDKIKELFELKDNEVFCKDNNAFITIDIKIK